jgi:beta-lactamase superfamily II metal-dependent hydrolase
VSTRLLRFAATLLLCGSAALAKPAAKAPAEAVHGKLTVYFFDIGQGDSELIISPTGKTMLIDGGPPDHTQHLVDRVKELVHGPLDLVVLTHPHLDHLGGLAAVIEAVGAKRYMDDGFIHPGKTYSHLLEVVAKQVGTRVTPEVDPKHPEDLITIGLGGGANFTILWPRRPVEDFLTGTRSDPNSNSVVGKLVFGKTAFMFVGDAEPDTEAYLLQKKINFHSTVLKVGHHGGRHSSTTEWLDAIKPAAAVISCGVGNDYGHPGQATLDRLKEVGAHVYRTDQMGEVMAVSDGVSVTLHAEREDVAATRFVGDVSGPVQLGPIVAGERTASQATLEDRKRYGKDDGTPDASPAAPAETQSVKATVPAPLPPPPSPDALIPDEIKARYPEGDAQEVRFIASKRSHVFHRADCAAVATIKRSNRIVFTSRAAAAKDHRPAGDCNP